MLPVWLTAVGVVVLVGLVVGDALAVRDPILVHREVPRIVSRGYDVDLAIEIEDHAGAVGTVRLRQPAPPDVSVTPAEGDGGLRALLRARRRGKHTLGRVAVRRDGPLGLGRWYHRAADDFELLVYPDLPAARRIALAVRRGRFREAGRMTRGPLGLGTDFESIRDYLPDDDIRQVNWMATSRVGRPMSNQYRIEQDRDVICLVDTGRLMWAPIGDLTRLDAAMDAVTAIALVADVVGDRCGATAFDSENPAFGSPPSRRRRLDSARIVRSGTSACRQRLRARLSHGGRL